MRKYLLTLYIIILPLDALSANFRSNLDEAIVPSVICGVFLLVIVQGGHFISHRLWRTTRLILVRRQRRLRH